MKIEEYILRLKERGISSIPLETPKGYSVSIKHRCKCKKVFSRSPAHMLGAHATGQCKDCSLNQKRLNKIVDNQDNGYLEFCKKNNYSLPLDIKDYVNRHTKIKHLCKQCHKTFMKAPGKSFRKSYKGVCPTCTRKSREPRITLSVFQKKLSILKGAPEYLDFYTGVTNKAAFLCGCGEIFERTPSKVLSGQLNCLKCSTISRSKSQALSVQEHNKKMKDRGFKSKLISKEIENNRNKLKYKCECGKFFERSPAHMFKKGSWGTCNSCYKERSSARQKWSQSDYDKVLSVKRPGIRRIGKYVGSQVKTQHKCICGNREWFPKPNNLIQSFDTCGCQKGTKSEKLLRQIIQYLTGLSFPSAKPEFLKNPKTGSRLELDGYNEKINYAFEYDGSQHHSYSEHFHRNEQAYLDQRARDRLKNKLCKNNNVTLLRFSGIEVKIRRLRKHQSELIELVNLVKEKLIKSGVKVNKTSNRFTANWDLIDGLHSKRKS